MNFIVYLYLGWFANSDYRWTPKRNTKNDNKEFFFSVCYHSSIFFDILLENFRSVNIDQIYHHNYTHPRRNNSVRSFNRISKVNKIQKINDCWLHFMRIFKQPNTAQAHHTVRIHEKSASDTLPVQCPPVLIWLINTN